MIIHSKPLNTDDIFESLDNQNKKEWKIILYFSEIIKKKNYKDYSGNPAHCA